MGEVSAVVVTAVSQAAEESTQNTGGSLPAGSVLSTCARHAERQRSPTDTERGCSSPREETHGCCPTYLTSSVGDGTDHCA